jgi:hypothetical protein
MLRILNKRYFSSNIKNHIELHKRINELQKEIETIIQKNDLDITIYKYKFTYPEKKLNFNENEYIKEEKKIIIENIKFLNS